MQFRIVMPVILSLAVTVPLTAQPRQAPPISDSAAMHAVLDAVLASPDYRIARAPGDTATRIFRLFSRSADSTMWKPFYPAILQRLHARLMTEQDQSTNELTISAIRVTGDTLLARYSIGDRQRCPTEPWMGGASSFDLQLVRSTTGWISTVRPGGIGDTRRCRT